MQFSTVTISVIAWLMLKEKMTISKILSISAIMLGTFLLITKGQLIIPHMGDVLLLLACIAWGFGGVLVRKIFKQHSVSPEIVSFLKPIAGIPLLIIFVLFSSFYPSSVKQIFQVNIFAVHQPLYILLNAFFVSLLWLFSARTLKIASASYAAIMSSITPILVAFLAVIFLHEKIDLIQSIGILLIIASSFVTQLLKFDKHENNHFPKSSLTFKKYSVYNALSL
jgi:drug/metabolite transporter (DMT)-like permease